MSSNKYKVVSLSVGGLGNKIYRTGAIVEAACFATPIADLVADGHLVAYEASEAAQEEADRLAQEGASDAATEKLLDTIKKSSKK